VYRQNRVSREKNLKESPGAKARRGWLRVLTPRTGSEADPSILFIEDKNPAGTEVGSGGGRD
jgi:hypothetical protein